MTSLRLTGIAVIVVLTFYLLRVLLRLVLVNAVDEWKPPARVQLVRIEQVKGIYAAALNALYQDGRRVIDRPDGVNHLFGKIVPHFGMVAQTGLDHQVIAYDPRSYPVFRRSLAPHCRPG